MSKRGISALIAVVLILGFTIAVGAVVLTWGGGFIKNLQESTERSAEKQMTCTSDVRLDIRKVKFLGNKVELLIENVGKIDIEKFYVRVYGSGGVDSIEVNSSLSIFGISNYEVEFDPGKTGFVESVGVFPSIIYGNEIISCSNVKAKGEVGYSSGLSCLGLLQEDSDLGSGVYVINPNGESIHVYCDMERDGGGWTLIMNLDDDTNLFVYESPYWTNSDIVNNDIKVPNTNPDGIESKYEGYSSVIGDELMVTFTNPNHYIRYTDFTKKTALDVFNGGQNMVYGNLADGVCHGQLLDDHPDYDGNIMNFGQARQFFGINIVDEGKPYHNGRGRLVFASDEDKGHGVFDLFLGIGITCNFGNSHCNCGDTSVAWEMPNDDYDCSDYGTPTVKSDTSASLWIR